MQDENSFDLNCAVQHWRERLAQAPSFRCENLDELESHLRDSIVTLQSHGLSLEESFLIASRRLGNMDLLGAEFAKINANQVWRERAFRMLAGMLFLIAGWELSRTAGSALVYLGSTVTSVSGIALGYGMLLAEVTMIGFIGVLFRLLTTGRLLPDQRAVSMLRRRPFVVAAILLGGILALRFGTTVFEILLIRNLPATKLGQVYMINSWFGVIGPILCATILLFFFRLLSQRAKEKTHWRASILIFIPLLALQQMSSSAMAATTRNHEIIAVADNKSATLDDAMKLWIAGMKDDAAAKFLAVDFSKRPLFPSGSVLNYTEAQFIALPQAAREKLSGQMMADIQVIKEIANHLKAARQNALAAGDKTKADEFAAKLQQCGNAFDQPDSLAILKLVGKALKKMAAGVSSTTK